MGVLIRGMVMPKDEGDSIHILRYGTAVVYRAESIDFYKAVPVPAHGRLIDADELRAFAYQRQKELGIACCVDALDIASAPTIIPACEKVYGKYVDTAGNLRWTGTYSGEHVIPAEPEEEEKS